jgi:hypothetical protein
MKFIIGLIFSIVSICLVWACLKVLFVSDAQGGPGFFVQSWHESPIATLIAIVFLIICAIGIFGSKNS